MGRWLALAVVVATAGSAHAAPKKKVLIQSTPDKASVYVGSVEEGEKCKTPCTIEVDSESIVIVDLAGHKPKSEAIIIKKTEKAPYKRSYKLVKSVGTLKVEGPAGASVFLDNADTDKKIPYEEDVPAGSHVVTVKVDGKELYSQAIEVPEDEDFKVTVPAKAVAKKDPDEEDDDTDTKPETGPTITKKTTPSGPRTGNLFAMSAAFSVGFRDFTYRNVEQGTPRRDLGPENEGGQVLAGVFAEVWPGNLLGVRFLRGFALVGRAQVGVNSQQVIKSDNTNLGATTFWRSFEGSARQRWVVANTAALEFSVGYVRDIHSFNGNANEVPSVDYQSLKLGGRASILLGQLEPYLAIENRIVMSGGQLADRFQGANASGVRGALGLDLRLGHISGKLEGSITRYSWTFNNDPMNDTDGATDSIKQVGLFAGYAY